MMELERPGEEKKKRWEAKREEKSGGRGWRVESESESEEKSSEKRKVEAEEGDGEEEECLGRGGVAVGHLSLKKQR